DVEFVGVWGRDQTKAAALAGQYGAKAYGSVDALIDDVEAVAIALPPDVQAPLALRAAHAGRHLLLDKPVAFQTEFAEEIAAATADHDVASVVFFTRRFTPQLQQFLAEAVATGGWVEARVDHVGTIYDEGNPFGASAWRREIGGLWDVGPHAVALVLPVLGKVAEVAAMVAPHDMTHLMMRHVSGAVSKITLSVDVPPAAAREEAMFAGRAGVWNVPEIPWEPVTAYGHALDALLAAVRRGVVPEMDIQFGAQVTAILAAAQEAARTGRTTPVTG
ncbi:MAG TPA: Gfo/Idh/MocA family oxidoreductase, partial [Actinoplanes sp.]|nr:Gfo/Idh/MocA family oxidoreductase [Actinoplanes sp.]